jgi:transcriptional regulator with XRE-family HTH domain
MRLSSAKLEALREAKGLTLNALLRISGVSKTAYYHLLNKESVLPRSLESLAGALGVKPSAFLAEGEDAKRRMMRLLKRAERVRRHEPGLDPENIRHVLLLLEDRPIDRLRRSLIRAQKPDLRV